MRAGTGPSPACEPVNRTGLDLVTWLARTVPPERHEGVPPRMVWDGYPQS